MVKEDKCRLQLFADSSLVADVTPKQLIKAYVKGCEDVIHHS